VPLASSANITKSSLFLMNFIFMETPGGIQLEKKIKKNIIKGLNGKSNSFVEIIKIYREHCRKSICKEVQNGTT
jgi:hypothetical protein